MKEYMGCLFKRARMRRSDFLRTGIAILLILFCSASLFFSASVSGVSGSEARVSTKTKTHTVAKTKTRTVAKTKTRTVTKTNEDFNCNKYRNKYRNKYCNKYRNKYCNKYCNKYRNKNRNPDPIGNTEP